MGDYLFSAGGKESSSTLLFFRALCDLGVASRFIFYQIINEQVCESKNCYLDGELDLIYVVNKFLNIFL